MSTPKTSISAKPACFINFCAWWFLALPATAVAAPATITVKAERDLEFGTFAVPSSGWRSVSTSGETAGGGILVFSGGPVGPARFSIIYDRGNESKRAEDILVQVIITAPRNYIAGGISASLTAIITDLPQTQASASGAVATILIANCRERQCLTSFNVGGRIEITRIGAGAGVRMPIAVTASIVSIG